MRIELLEACVIGALLFAHAVETDGGVLTAASAHQFKRLSDSSLAATYTALLNAALELALALGLEAK